MVFNFDQDVFICAIYIPPRYSPYFDPDTFHNLENDIANPSEDGYMILAGDFNARTTCALDFIDSDGQNLVSETEELWQPY